MPLVRIPRCSDRTRTSIACRGADSTLPCLDRTPPDDADTSLLARRRFAIDGSCDSRGRHPRLANCRENMEQNHRQTNTPTVVPRYCSLRSIRRRSAHARRAESHYGLLHQLPLLAGAHGPARRPAIGTGETAKWARPSDDCRPPPSRRPCSHLVAVRPIATGPTSANTPCRHQRKVRTDGSCVERRSLAARPHSSVGMRDRKRAGPWRSSPNRKLLSFLHQRRCAPRSLPRERQSEPPGCADRLRELMGGRLLG